MVRFMVATALAVSMGTPAIAEGIGAPAVAEGIGVAWVGSSSNSERVLGGLRERMAEVAPDWAVDARPALDDFDALREVFDRFAATYGGVVVMRSNGSKWLAENPPSVPAFIGAGNHPPSIGVIESMAAPEGNVTGVTYYLEPIVVLETLSAVAPFDHLLVVQEEGHPGSDVDRDAMAPACEEMFIDCTFVRIEDGTALAGAIAGHSGHDAVFVGNQTPLFDDEQAFRAGVAAAGEAPVFGFHRRIVEMGGLAALGADDHKLGRMLADRVLAVMRDGQAIVDTPVGTDPEPLLMLNEDTLTRLGLNVPRQMIETAEMVEPAG